MKFSQLSNKDKQNLHLALIDGAKSIGSVNSLLHMIEDLHKQPQSPLSSKDMKFSFSKGFVKWNKFIYKETLELLFNTIIKQDKGEDLKQKEQKRVLNMLKTLKPVSITIKPKNQKDGDGFSLNIVEVDENGDSKISLLFKVLFFYKIDFAKKALAFKNENKDNYMDKDIIGFGIAGNFAHHLEQAGESADFVEVEAAEGAPKGIFPTYVPNHDTFLGVYPFSNTEVTYVEGKNTQMEPEVALFCDVEYEDEKVKTLTPTHFGAYNDCSMRVEGAEKISHKKNWGKNSKVIAKNMLDIDKFSKGGVMDNYSLTSFIKRDDKLIQYGENSELLGYSYFYERLNDWMIDKLNTQKDVGPLEDLNALIKSASFPKRLVISIGATRYTDFGEHNYLNRGDILYVVVYDHKKYSHEDIIKMIEDDKFEDDSISALVHKVV